MKKTLLLAVACAALLAFFSGCSLFASYTIDGFASGCLYLTDTQTVTLAIPDDFGCKFKENLSCDGIILDDRLDGKTVCGVKFIDKKHIAVTVTGTSAVKENKTQTYTIKVDRKCFTGGSVEASYDVVLKNTAPVIMLADTSVSRKDDVLDVTTELLLPYGEFYADKCTGDNIRQKNGNADLSITVDNDIIKLTVKGYVCTEEDPYPVVVIAPECSSFGIQITVVCGGNNAYNELELK